MAFQPGRRVLLGGGALFSCLPSAATARTVASAGSLLPEDQRAFAAAVDEAWQASTAEKDAAARARILVQRAGDLRRALGDPLDFQDWRCTLTYIASLRETTLVALHVLGSKGRARATIGNFSFAEGDDVRIEPDSPLARQARGLRLEEQVLASGIFKPDSQRGCAGAYGKPASTGDAEFEIPLFTVRFTALMRAPHDNGTARDFEQAIVPPRRDEG